MDIMNKKLRTAGLLYCNTLKKLCSTKLEKLLQNAKLACVPCKQQHAWEVWSSNPEPAKFYTML